jgi:hypothetical protein
VFVEGNMNSNKYVQVLENHFLPFVAQHAPARRWWLQDDNASIHRSQQTETWKRQNNIPSFFWPPQSPDLNPIVLLAATVPGSQSDRKYLAGAEELGQETAERHQHSG